MHSLNAAQSRKHLPVLDSVRGVAILAVFCYHLLAACFGAGHEQVAWSSHSLFRDFHSAPDHMLWFYPMTFGVIGVPLFFVLSGFVIHYSTLTSRHQFSLSDFFSRRFWRIYPPYLLAVLLFFVLPSSLVHLEHPTLRSLATHLALVHDFDNQTIFLINPSFWSIATEVQFYLVYPLLLLFRPRWGMLTVLLGMLTLSLTVRTIICLLKLRHHQDVFDDTHLMLWNLPLITIFDWTLGAFIADQFAGGKRVFPKQLAVPIFATVIYLGSTFIRPLSIFSFQLGSVMCAVWMERLIWSDRPLTRWQRWLAPLGLCSYSFYLLHQPLLDMLLPLLQKWGERSNILPGSSPVIAVLVLGPIIFVLLVGASGTVYRLVERPCMQLGRLIKFSARKIDANGLDSVASGISPSGKPNEMTDAMKPPMPAGSSSVLRVAGDSTS